MLYKCDKCNKIFDHKSKYNKHLERKFSCNKENNIKNENNKLDKKDMKIVSISNNIQNGNNTYPNGNNNISNNGNILDNHQNINEYVCIGCDKNYKYYAGLYKHKKNYPECCIKKDEICTNDNKNNKDNKDDKIQKLEEQVKILMEKIKNSKPKNTNINNTNTNTNSNNTNNGLINTNNIQIIQFGKEDVYKLSNNELNKILFKKGGDPLLDLIECMHFNDKIPEHKNIKYTNIASKYIDIHNGKNWIKQPLNNILNDLYENHITNLQEIQNNVDDTEKIKKSVQKSIDTFMNYHKLLNKELEYSDDNNINDKNDKIKIDMINAKEDMKLFIHNKSKESNILDV